MCCIAAHRCPVCHLPTGLHLLLWAGVVGCGAAGSHPDHHHPCWGALACGIAPGAMAYMGRPSAPPCLHGVRQC